MSEIRDKVKEQLEAIFQGYMQGETWEGCMEKIMDIPELAVVDREATPPPLIYFPQEQSIETFGKGIQQDMLRAGWVKESRD